MVVRIGEITERVLGEYPDAVLGRLTPAERGAVEAAETRNEGNVIVVPVNRGVMLDDFQAVRLAENFSMLVGHRVPDGAILAAAYCFREPSFQVHQAEDMLIRWGYEIPAAVPSTEPDEDDDILQCPSCGEVNPIDADACVNCGMTGPPFSLSVDLRKRIAPTQPIALTVHIDGQNVTAKGGVEPGKYVYLRCPECGLIQDADHSKCSRCGHDLTEARKGMFATLEKEGKKPTLHSSPPPPASEQPDLRKATT